MMQIVIRDRGYLPHWEVPGSVYFVTFRLADSLPAEVLIELEELRQREDTKRDVAEKIEAYLDRGAGACYLRDSRVAEIVKESLFHFDGSRYRLLTWCIMPNHVHLMIAVHPDFTLEKVVHSIKSFTANKANEALNRRGSFWQREYYDRLIRDADEYERTMEYIVGNPDAALLVNWPWRGYEGQDGQGAPGFDCAGFPRGGESRGNTKQP